MKTTPFFLAALFAFVFSLTGCSNNHHNGTAAGGTSSEMIGATGGQLPLPGGGGVLVFPAGAVAADTLITITAVDPSDLGANFSNIPGVQAFSIDPVGMALAVPATLQINLPLVAQEGTGQTKILNTDVPFVFSDTVSFGSAPIRTSISEGAQSATAEVDFDSLGRVTYGFGNTYRYEVNYPASIEAGATEVIRVEVTATADFTPTTAAVLTWANVPTGDFTSSLGNSEVPFSANSAPILAPGTGASDTFTVTCNGSGTDLTLAFQVRAKPIEGLLATPSGDAIQTSPIEVVQSLTVMLNCKQATGLQQTLIDTSGVIAALEAITLLPSSLTCKGPNGFDLLLAGKQIGSSDPKAIIVDPIGGIITEQFDLPGGGGIGTAFDAQFVMPPTGASAGVLPWFVATGNGSVEKSVQPGCSLSAISGLGFSFYQDTTCVAQDPKLGLVSAQAGGLDLRYLDQTSTVLTFEQVPLSFSVKTAVSNSTRDHFLAISTSGQLHAVQWDGNNATDSLVGGITLGSNSRRMRWDPTTGLLGISDFSDNTITALTWDGSQNVALIGTTSVGPGPVGIDVMGNRIVSAGFVDGSHSIVEIDLVTLQILSTTTTPNPFPSAQNPGHALFMRDPDNSIALSYNGNSMLGVIPNAF